MAETPEEVARKLLESGLCAHGERNEFLHAYECEVCLSAAIRAQYVAGLERGALASAAFDGPEAAAIGRRIRELAEQAKREG